MTTIAWDGKNMASDSQSSMGDLVCSISEQKIHIPKKGETWIINNHEIAAIGMSGDCGSEMELIDKLKAGINYDTEFSPVRDFSAIAVVSPLFAYLLFKDKSTTHALISKQIEPVAIGSGGICAQVAMLCGKNAMEAVDIAKTLDIYSGGDTRSFRVIGGKP
ncbi:hypothetical protein [Xenorhabdus littoralis]|uniref:hypothetical protein n=1 Tax=Xenorhabdus littoralis TaxID=2582835 RepID=UPI0029E823A7|nr:hypothetical protein [Xenorhabdus sp. psl]MDX7992879.1 hypothetical protein [Xenorhabdus sp. psl]